MNKAWGVFAAALMVGGVSVPAHAADAVKIGVIYPLTGNAASAGQSAKDAVDLAADIVNTGHPELKAMPVGGSAGLPNLGGAKIELDEADHQGNPQVGQQQQLVTGDRQQLSAAERAESDQSMADNQAIGADKAASFRCLARA